MGVIVESTSSATNGPAVTSVGVTKPTGLAVGDLLFACISANGAAGNPGLITPSGWTALTGQVSDQCESNVFYKIADSSDVAASSFTFSTTSSSNIVAGLLLRLSGHNPLTPVAASNGTTGTSDTITITGVTPTISDSVLVQCGSASAGTSVTFSGYAVATSNPSWTEQFDAIGDNNMRSYLATASRPEITATGNATVTIDNGSHNWRGFIVCVKAADPSISAGFTLTTASLAPTVPLAVTATAGFTLTGSIPAPTPASVDPDFINTSKNSASMANTSKNAASFSNTSKNAATFTDVAKN